MGYRKFKTAEQMTQQEFIDTYLDDFSSAGGREEWEEYLKKRWLWYQNGNKETWAASCEAYHKIPKKYRYQ